MTEPTTPTLPAAALDAANARTAERQARQEEAQREHIERMRGDLRRLTVEKLDNYADGLRYQDGPDGRVWATHDALPDAIHFELWQDAYDHTSLIVRDYSGDAQRAYTIHELADLGDVIRERAHRRAADVLEAGDVEPFGEAI